MSAASLSPAFDFVISHPDRAPTVGNEALREDFETGSRSPLASRPRPRRPRCEKISATGS